MDSDSDNSQVSVVETENSKEGGRRPGENPVIPGLPDDIAELCLLRIPYPYQAPVCTVSSSWNRVIKDPGFVLSKRFLSLSLPYVFVMAFHKSTARIQWQALDPRSGRWFVLPTMPGPTAGSPSAFACSSVQRLGQLFVLGGMRSDMESPMDTMVTYHVSSNRWSVLSPMRTPRAFFTAQCVGDRIIVLGGCGPDLSTTISSVECYDLHTSTWTEGAGMRHGLAKYDSVVMGNRVYLTEGWTWPFMFVPRGMVYDLDNNGWHEMSEGMREGWTGFGIVLWNRLFVMSEHGDHRLKVYVPKSDTWCYVNGDKFPCEALHKPLAVSGGDGVIYVVASGLNAGVGRVFEAGNGEFSVEWEVLPAPKAFRDFSPCNAQLLYA